MGVNIFQIYTGFNNLTSLKVTGKGWEVSDIYSDIIYGTYRAFFS